LLRTSSKVFPADDELSWAEAEAKCVSMDGHLVTINTPVEQDFVSQQIVLGSIQYVWIGLNDLRSFNEFEWVDGSPVRWIRLLN